MEWTDNTSQRSRITAGQKKKSLPILEVEVARKPKCLWPPLHISACFYGSSNHVMNRGAARNLGSEQEVRRSVRCRTSLTEALRTDLVCSASEEKP